jgi:hypothetical protein
MAALMVIRLEEPESLVVAALMVWQRETFVMSGLSGNGRSVVWSVTSNKICFGDLPREKELHQNLF